MKRLTLVYAYYNNPTMLSEQYSKWVRYSPELKERVDIVVVDDGSQQKAVDVPRPADLPELRIFRIAEDRPWHQNAARNLGAKYGHGTGDWLLLTDMDHVVPEDTIKALMEKARNGGIYRFHRLEAGTMKPTLDRKGLPKPHPNTWAMSRDMYWDLGGYDERTCGYYGTDSIFRAKIEKRGIPVAILKAPVIRYGRENIPDASTTNLKRKEDRKPGWREALIAKLNTSPAPEPGRFHWYEEKL